MICRSTSVALENYLAVELMEKHAAEGLNLEYLFLPRILIDCFIIVKGIWLALVGICQVGATFSWTQMIGLQQLSE